MANGGDEGMGRVTIEAGLTNATDRGMVERGVLPADQVRSTPLRGVVDTGAVMLVLPEAVARQLGLTKTGEMQVRYADHRTATRDVVGYVEVDIGGRRSVFDAIAEPDRATALYGAIILERLDLLVDCKTQTVVPRDPDVMITEIE